LVNLAPEVVYDDVEGTRVKMELGLSLGTGQLGKDAGGRRRELRRDSQIRG
jgi:hypothetical protein